MQKILIAEPDKRLAAKYHMALLTQGYQVNMVEDGVNCIQEVRSSGPDLLVINVDLPWGWAEGVLGLLSEESVLSNLNVILIGPRSNETCYGQGQEFIKARCNQSVSPRELVELADQILFEEKDERLLWAPWSIFK